MGRAKSLQKFTEVTGQVVVWRQVDLWIKLQDTLEVTIHVEVIG